MYFTGPGTLQISEIVYVFKSFIQIILSPVKAAGSIGKYGACGLPFNSFNPNYALEISNL